MTTLEKFQEYTSHCPKQYPYNNKLRREHKATISKAMRKKREDEIFRYLRSAEMFDVTEAYVEELMSQHCDEIYQEFVGYKDLELGDANEYILDINKENLYE